MRSAVPIHLSAKQRGELEAFLALRNAPAGHIRRVRVALLAADGVRNVEIARRLDLSVPQVSRIRHRFLQSGVSGLAEQPRSGRGNRVESSIVRRVVTLVMNPPPPGFSHWSTRLVGRQTGLSNVTVHKILRENDLKPHLLRTFKISKDPNFEQKALDVVGLYLDPPDNAIVLCVDEKTQVQALERTQPMLPLRPGKERRRTHDYRRHGVVDLYAALEIATGDVVAQCRESHTAQDFLAFLKLLRRRYPIGELHVVLDNSSTHKTPEVWAWLRQNPRFILHFTPTSASWMNQVEGFFGILTRRSLQQTSFSSKAELRRHLEAFIKSWNATSGPFVWTKSAHRIVRDHRRILARTSKTAH